MSDRPSDETLREWTRILTPGQAAMARELLEARERIADTVEREAAVCPEDVSFDDFRWLDARLALAEEVVKAVRPGHVRLKGLIDHVALSLKLDRYDAGREGA